MTHDQTMARGILGGLLFTAATSTYIGLEHGFGFGLVAVICIGYLAIPLGVITAVLIREM